MYKTYATKYRTGKSKIIDKFRVGKDFGVKFKSKDGKEKVRLFYNEGFKRKKTASYNDCDNIPDYKFHLGGTSLINRLKAGKCEICGAENSPIEIHHVRRLKDLKGKNFWEAFMIITSESILTSMK